MDGLITVAELREIFDISADIKPTRLKRHLVAAGRQMRAWVGDAAYTDALLDDPADDTRKEDLELAEAHMAMSIAILGLNTALRARGIVKQERSGQGDVIVQYHTPAEITALQAQYLQTAKDIARAYIVVDDTTVEPFGIAVGGGDSSWEGTTRNC
jgi:hypothetical protein